MAYKSYAKAGELIYDQAKNNYEVTINRIQSRFTARPFSFYKLFLSGSSRTKDSTIEQIIRDLQKHNDKASRVYRNVQYKVRPSPLYSGKVFSFCVGSEKYKAHVIEKGEKIKPDMQVFDDVPIEYEGSARMNPNKFQRDVLGIPTDAISSFIGDNQLIRDAFTERIKSIVFKNNVILGRDADPDTYLSINEDHLPSLEFRQNTPHWISIDLSKSGCATGISMNYISHLELVNNALQAHFRVPLCASIQPNNGINIRPEKIREFIYKLRDEYHYWIAGVSYDSWGSPESLQQLEDNGFCVAEISTVRTPEPYEDFKSAILQKRIKIAANEKAEKETRELEETIVGQRTIIDKPANGSKDMADTLAAGIYYANQSAYFAELRLEHSRTGKIPDIKLYKKKNRTPNIITQKWVSHLNLKTFMKNIGWLWLTLLIFSSLQVNANSCKNFGNTINCGNKEIYRKIGNRIYGPNNSQYLIQGDRISQIGSKTTYLKINRWIVRNNQTSYTKQGSYILSNKGEQYIKQGNQTFSKTKQDPIIDLLFNQE